MDAVSFEAGESLAEKVASGDTADSVDNFRGESLWDSVAPFSEVSLIACSGRFWDLPKVGPRIPLVFRGGRGAFSVAAFAAVSPGFCLAEVFSGASFRGLVKGLLISRARGDNMNSPSVIVCSWVPLEERG